MTNIPKVIFLDWFGTLSYSEMLDHLAETSHPMHSKLKQIKSFLYTHRQTDTLELLKGTMSMRDFCYKLSQRIGVPDWELLNEFAISFSRFKWVDNVIPHIILKIRKKGIKVVLISNTSQAFRKYTIPMLKLDKYFDDFLLSCDIKHLKYDTSLEDLLFFKTYLESEKLQYEDCLIIDNNPEEKILDIMDVKYEIATDTESLKSILKNYI